MVDNMYGGVSLVFCCAQGSVLVVAINVLFSEIIPENNTLIVAAAKSVDGVLQWRHGSRWRKQGMCEDGWVLVRWWFERGGEGLCDGWCCALEQRREAGAVVHENRS